MISVIVPVYNAEKYLDRCIQSLIKQTYKNIEVVLVDDGSSDNSSKICQSYANDYDHISFYRMEKNAGQVAAYTLGIKKSNGDLIGFVDSDDWIEPTMYEELINSLVEKKADISSCGIYMDFPSHTVIEPKNIEEYDGKIFTQEQIHDDFYELHLPNNEIDSILKLYRCTRIYKREIILNNLKYLQNNIRVFEDNNFVIPCLLDAKLVNYVGKPLYHYCRRSNSTMGSFNSDILKSNRDFLINQERIYTEKKVNHLMNSDAFVVHSFSLNGILNSNDSLKKKMNELTILSKDVEKYNFTFHECRRFGASKKFAFLMDNVAKRNLNRVLLLGEIYKIVKKVK